MNGRGLFVAERRRSISAALGIIAALGILCTLANALHANEEEILQHAARLCMQTGNELLSVMNDQQRNAFFFANPSLSRGDMQVQFVPIIVGAPLENLKDWNGYAQVGSNGVIAVVVTDEMVKSLYQLAKIQAYNPPEAWDDLTENLAERIASNQDLGSLQPGAAANQVDANCRRLACGLIAHEFAHIYLGHLSVALREMGFSAESDPAKINAQLKKLAYQRAKETEADGAALDSVARIEPNMALGMLYFYDLLARVEDKMGGAEIPQVLRTHPEPRPRIREFLSRLANNHGIDVRKVCPRWFLERYFD